MRIAMLVVALGLVACDTERGLGEGCEGNALVGAHCADGLVCDDKAEWTCQLPGHGYGYVHAPSSTSTATSPAPSAAPRDDQDGGTEDASTEEAGTEDAGTDE